MDVNTYDSIYNTQIRTDLYVVCLFPSSFNHMQDKSDQGIYKGLIVSDVQIRLHEKFHCLQTLNVLFYMFLLIQFLQKRNGRICLCFPQLFPFF